MNNVIIIGAGSVSNLAHMLHMDCPKIVVDLSQFKEIECSFHYARIDRVEIPPMPESFSWEFDGYVINEYVVSQLRSLSHSLAISMAKVVDAVRNLEKHTFSSSIDIDALTLAMGKIKIEQDYEAIQSKPTCTKPFKSKIKKSQYAASTYQRSGFQASRKLARGRI